MWVDPKQVVLNAVARFGPAARFFKSVRGVRRSGYAATAAQSVAGFQVRRQWFGPRIAGADILEIGSGRHFGLALLLVHAGARRVVNVEIDPHGFVRDRAFYSVFAEQARSVGIPVAWPPPGLLEDARTGLVQPDPALIKLHLDQSAAAIPEPDGAFDITFSVSVLQHVRREQVVSVARELFRVTRPGGLGYHRVDLADLQSKDPLRHLCYTDRQYRLMFQHRGSYCNRYRTDDLERIFRSVGFDVRFEDVRAYERDEELLRRWQPRFTDEFRYKSREVLRARECMLVLSR